MEEASILLPIKCPKCGTTALVAYPVIVVVTAVTQWKQMRLNATCHEESWDASAEEIQAIREHVGERWLAFARHGQAQNWMLANRSLARAR